MQHIGKCTSEIRNISTAVASDKTVVRQKYIRDTYPHHHQPPPPATTTHTTTTTTTVNKSRKALGKCNGTTST